jgi:hypothetical protein
VKTHYDADCPPSLGEPVAVIGYGGFLTMRRNDPDHPIEKVGRELRSMMTWLEPVEK